MRYINKEIWETILEGTQATGGLASWFIELVSSVDVLVYTNDFQYIGALDRFEILRDLNAYNNSGYKSEFSSNFKYLEQLPDGLSVVNEIELSFHARPLYDLANLLEKAVVLGVHAKKEFNKRTRSVVSDESTQIQIVFNKVGNT